MTTYDELNSWADEILSKGGGPYIGPRGGKWADAKHTIPWKDRKKRAKKGTDGKYGEAAGRAALADAEALLKRVDSSGATIDRDDRYDHVLAIDSLRDSLKSKAEARAHNVKYDPAEAAAGRDEWYDKEQPKVAAINRKFAMKELTRTSAVLTAALKQGASTESNAKAMMLRAKVERSRLLKLKGDEVAQDAAGDISDAWGGVHNAVQTGDKALIKQAMAELNLTLAHASNIR